MNKGSQSHGTVLSVNVGRVQSYVHNGQAKQSAIWKSPASGRARVARVGFEGDEHAERAHGGLDQAVYAYSREDYEWWEGELSDEPLAPGTFGENVTCSGLEISEVLCGEQIRFGTALLEATLPRIPCGTFQYRMALDGWIERFSKAIRPGVYFRVIEEGEVGAGDAIEVQSKPESGITVYEMFRIRVFEPQRAREILEAPRLSEKWRAWAESAVGGSSS